MRRLLAALALAALLPAGCGAASPRDAGAPTTGPIVNDEIRSARTALGEPAVAVARALLRSSDRLDTIRHEEPRGERMQQAVTALTADIAELRTAAERAAGAVSDLTDDPTAGAVPQVVDAMRLLGEAAEQAGEAAQATEGEAAFLAALADADRRMDDVVRRWDTPGSQSQLRTLLSASAAELRSLSAQAAQVAPVPADCPTLRDNRGRWALLLAERTGGLAAQATGAGGTAYDQLRASFRQQPYGEDRVAADAADRPCWQAHSPLARAADTAPTVVARLEQLLG